MLETQEYIVAAIYVFYPGILAFVFWPVVFRPELNREKEYYSAEAKRRLRRIFPRWIISFFVFPIFHQIVLNWDFWASLVFWAIMSVFIIPTVYYQALLWDMRSSYKSKESNKVINDDS